MSSAATLFVSDLHLDASRPECTALFVDFLRTRAREAQALYILGDLFEAWVGDDAATAHDRQVMDALAALSASGVPCAFMHGNRDFLVGSEFAEITGCRLLVDPAVIDLDGTATLLSHGDALCTADTEYQAFRRQVRAPEWQAQFLAMSATERRAFAQAARERSQASTRGKAEAIMDVSQEAVDTLMDAWGIDQLIHGHTHRPAIHRWTHSGRHRTRAVLGDWYEQGSVLVADAQGLRLEGLGSTRTAAG